MPPPSVWTCSCAGFGGGVADGVALRSADAAWGSGFIANVLRFAGGVAALACPVGIGNGMFDTITPGDLDCDAATESGSEVEMVAEVARSAAASNDGKSLATTAGEPPDWPGSCGCCIDAVLGRLNDFFQSQQQTQGGGVWQRAEEAFGGVIGMQGSIAGHQKN